MREWMAGIALVFGCISCAADADKTPGLCGNERLDADESCDGALIDSDFLCSDGQRPIGCDACVPECPAPSLCGDSIVDDGEACDGANVPACPTGTVGAVTCSATCEADASDCVPQAGTVMVHVSQGTANVQSVYVMSNQPDGTHISDCKTDAAGLCSFTGVPANVMITVIWSIPMGPVESYFLTTFTHVTSPQTIEFAIPPPLPGGMPISAQAYVPGPYTGATTAVTMNGCGEREFGDFTSVHEHGFNSTCLDANQEGGMYAEARDANATPLAWSYLRQNVTTNSTFTLPAWASSFSTLTAQITNVPSVMSTLRLECNAVLDNLVPLMRRRDVTPPAATESFTASIPTALATFARCAVHIGLSNQQVAQICEQRQAPPFTVFAFNGNNLLPPLTSSFTTAPINRWTCTFTSQPTPGADISECRQGFTRYGPTKLIAWQLIAPGSFIGTLTAPVLGPMTPISLAGAEVPGPGFGHASKQAYSDVISYSDYLDGRLVPVAGDTCAVYAPAY